MCCTYSIRYCKNYGLVTIRRTLKYAFFILNLRKGDVTIKNDHAINIIIIGLK